ncbi:MAG TPA: hypothetical protein VL494_13855 [Steroidobacteraceae bacterium]|jgi:hypothetical protein|nr:hypothetical protein [Steroidobacteraceae bacterium]
MSKSCKHCKRCISGCKEFCSCCGLCQECGQPAKTAPLPEPVYVPYPVYPPIQPWPTEPTWVPGGPIVTQPTWVYRTTTTCKSDVLQSTGAATQLGGISLAEPFVVAFNADSVH